MTIFVDPTRTHLNKVYRPVPEAEQAAPLCTCLQYIGDNPPCPIPGHDRPASAIVREAVSVCAQEPVHAETKYHGAWKGGL